MYHITISKRTPWAGTRLKRILIKKVVELMENQSGMLFTHPQCGRKLENNTLIPNMVAQ